jgi:hypothetical protein
MRLTRNLCILLLPVLAFGVFGCGDSAPPIPDSPDGTVKAVTEGLASNRPDVVWNAMPASYQKDVNDLVRLFASKMDAELYDRTFSVARKAVGVLRDKKDFILNHPMVGMMAGVDKDKASKDWGAVVGLLETLVQSDLSSLGKLKSLDVGAFLGGTGVKLMQQIEKVAALQEENAFEKNFKSKMKGVKAEVVSTEGGKTVLRLTAPGEKPEEIPFVKVEGRWVPEEMTRDWKKMIGEAKEQIEGMTGELVGPDRDKFLSMMKNVETSLGKLADAKDQGQFNMELGKLMGTFMGDMPGGLEEMTPGGAPPPLPVK